MGGSVYALMYAFSASTRGVTDPRHRVMAELYIRRAERVEKEMRQIGNRCVVRGIFLRAAGARRHGARHIFFTSDPSNEKK